MTGFLSPGWFAALDAAVRSARPGDGPGTSGGEELTVQFEVVGGPDGDVTYCVRLGGPAPGVVHGPHHGADVVFRADHETSRAISAGTVNALDAFQRGVLGVRGDVGRLVDARSGLSAVGARFAGIDARTRPGDDGAPGTGTRSGDDRTRGGAPA